MGAVLVVGVASIGIPSATKAQAASWPAAQWARGTPAEVGLSDSALGGLDARIRQGEFGHVDRLVIVRHGRLVVDARYEQDYREISRGVRTDIGCGFGCPDSSWDHQFNYLHPDWHPWYQGRDVHTLQSVTKSVAATLVGVAIARGAIPGVGAPLLPYLAGYDLSRVAPALHRATLQDLLTMRTGIEWHEGDRPLDSTNTTIQLERSPDWVQFTLDQPMDAEPGQKWTYNSGGSHLMSAIVQQATGTRMDRFAEEHLFGPLGIRDYHWKLTPTGLPDAEGGLYLEATDLARIGYLYLQDGVWNGARLLPEGWVADATARQVTSPGYGYQWWRPDPGGETVWAGMGFGGQFLLVLPERDVVAVVNSWNVWGRSTGRIVNEVVAALVAE